MESDEIRNLFFLPETAALEMKSVECWSARKMQGLLYSKWENFEKGIQKAKDSCTDAGEEVDYHFSDITGTISMPKRAEKEINDILLTRYDCCMIAQNGGSSKEKIAFAQNYLAVLTHSAELMFFDPRIPASLFDSCWSPIATLIARQLMKN